MIVVRTIVEIVPRHKEREYSARHGGELGIYEVATSLRYAQHPSMSLRPFMGGITFETEEIVYRGEE